MKNWNQRITDVLDMAAIIGDRGQVSAEEFMVRGAKHEWTSDVLGFGTLGVRCQARPMDYAVQGVRQLSKRCGVFMDYGYGWMGLSYFGQVLQHEVKRRGLHFPMRSYRVVLFRLLWRMFGKQMALLPWDGHVHAKEEIALILERAGLKARESSFVVRELDFIVMKNVRRNQIRLPCVPEPTLERLTPWVSAPLHSPPDLFPAPPRLVAEALINWDGPMLGVSQNQICLDAFAFALAIRTSFEFPGSEPLSQAEIISVCSRHDDSIHFVSKDYGALNLLMSEPRFKINPAAWIAR